MIKRFTPKPGCSSRLVLRWAAASEYALVSFSWIIAPNLTDLSKAVFRLCWQFFWAHTMHFSHFHLNSVTSLRVYFCISLWARVQWHALCSDSRIPSCPALWAHPVHQSLIRPRERLNPLQLLQNSIKTVLLLLFSSNLVYNVESVALLK